MATNAKLTAPVGANCENKIPADVRLIKQLLNAHSKKINLAQPLDVSNSAVGPKTIEAIRNFQRIELGNPQPSGRVKPDGQTLQLLLKTPVANQGSNLVTGKTAGVIPGIITYLNAVASHYGKELRVTSGKRSPEGQADAMWQGWGEHLERGKIYASLRANETVRSELDGYYNTAHAAHASAMTKQQAKQKFTMKIVSIASGLSRHLTGEAVDIALSTDKRLLDAIKVGFEYLEEKYKGVIRCHHFDTRKFGKAPEVTDALRATWPK